MKKMTLNVAIAALTLATACGLLTLPASAADKPSATSQQGGGPGMRQRGGGPGAGPRMGRGGLDGDELIARADSNNDGKVSAEEFLEPRLDRLDEMFERRDTNGDGLIAEGEGRRERPAATGRGDRAGRGGARGGRADRPAIDREAILACIQKAHPDFDLPAGPDGDETRFEAADANNDGSLSLAEVTAAETAHAQSRFAKLDTNGDGFITAAEIEAKQDDRAEIADAMHECRKNQ